MAEFLQLFTDYGAPYLLLAIALWVIRNRQNKIDDIQEKRLTESRESTEVIEANTAALKTLSELIKSRRSR